MTTLKRTILHIPPDGDRDVRDPRIDEVRIDESITDPYVTHENGPTIPDELGDTPAPERIEAKLERANREITSNNPVAAVEALRDLVLELSEYDGE